MTATLTRRTRSAPVGKLVPKSGDTFVSATVDGVDLVESVKRVWRETDQPGVFTIADAGGFHAWLRYDAWRGCWVRAYGQADGEPIPFVPRVDAQELV